MSVKASTFKSLTAFKEILPDLVFLIISWGILAN